MIVQLSILKIRVVRLKSSGLSMLYVGIKSYCIECVNSWIVDESESWIPATMEPTH